MEDNNNNMEEFFKRSLERFDEAPSNDVWTNISDRLSIEAKWYDPILIAIKSMYPFILAAVLIGAYHFYAQNKFDNFKNEISEANSTIQALQNKNLSYTSQIENIEQVKTEFLENINDKKLALEKLTQENKELAASRQQLLRNSKNNSSNALVLQNLRTKIQNLESKLKLKEAELLALNNKSDLEKTSPSNRTTEVFCSQFKHLPRVRSNRIVNQDFLLSNNKPNSFNPNVPKETESASLKFDRFKFGLKARYFNTLVKNSQLVNPGFSQGLRAEYFLAQKWAVTGDLTYNQRTYTIASSQGTFSRESLERYPGGVEEKLNVNNINSRTRYFDFNLGLKYTPNFHADKANFFINPSIVWHLYMPQEYQFSLSQESDIHYTQKTYLAYLGSGNLNMGFDKRINSRLHFQISLWGEQSFIPLGYEKQYVSMFGVSSSLLF